MNQTVILIYFLLYCRIIEEILGNEHGNRLDWTKQLLVPEPEDGMGVFLLRRLLSHRAAAEQVAWLTRSHRGGAAAMRFDCRTPTEHVQRWSAQITSVLMSFTHLISCRHSHPAEEHFLPDATLPCLDIVVL